MAPDRDTAATAADEAAEGAGATGSLPRRARMILLVAAVLVVSTIGGASAASLITGSQIKDGTVTGRDVRDHSLRPRDAKAGVVRPGARGPQGLTGQQGAAGVVAGAPGRNGLGGLVTPVSPDPLTVPADASGNGVATFTIPCPSGLKALNGGVAGQNSTAVDGMVLVASVPSVSGGAPTGWTVTVGNTYKAIDIGVYLWATCAAI